MKYIKKCKTCNLDFEAKSNMKNCQSCLDKKHFEEISFLNKSGKYKNECNFCKNIFATNIKRKKYCSTKCKSLFYKENFPDKIKLTRKNNYKNNKEKVNNKTKQHYKDNKEYYKVYKIKYKIENKDKIKKQNREYVKNKSKSDPIFKLKSDISRTIRMTLRANNSSKAGKATFKYLLYTVQELKEHLESLFEPWMNWNNWR